MNNQFDSEISVRTTLGGADFLKLCSIIGKRKFQLFHFTDIRNLVSIFQHGLVTRNDPLFSELEVHRKDEVRSDGNGTCLSVGFPNYKMLYTKRLKENSFAILELDSDCLLSGNWLAYPTNSATFDLQQAKFFVGLEALEGLFEDNLRTQNGKVVEREKLKISDSWATDPQAEIVVNERIFAEHIKEVHFDQAQHIEIARLLFQSPEPVPFSVTSKLFAGRPDSSFWKSDRLAPTKRSED